MLLVLLTVLHLLEGALLPTEVHLQTKRLLLEVEVLMPVTTKNSQSPLGVSLVVAVILGVHHNDLRLM